MDHLIARVRSAKGTEASKLKKVLSDQTVFTVTDDLTTFVPYEPDHNLDPGTWFGIDKFSEKPYFLPWLGQPFSSAHYDQLAASEGKQIDYICAYQEGNMYCFQKIAKSHYLERRFLSIGDQFSLQSDKVFLTVNEVPDAIYLKDRDILLFKSLPTISGIFKGIDTLYREATEGETDQFLRESPFIHLRDGFSAPFVSKPNRHRISMAVDTMKHFNDEQKGEMITYIREYCPDLPCQNNVFSIGTDHELKSLLYGIEQRYYTTIITREKRLANSVLSIGA